VTQVIGAIERVERPFPQLVEIEVGALDRVLLVSEHEHAWSGFGADHVVDDPVLQRGSGGNSRTASCTLSQCGPSIPRCATRRPMALATIAISNEIFVPSANEVAMCGVRPRFLANPSCVVGFR
jgi:hypothetical protein